MRSLDCSIREVVARRSGRELDSVVGWQRLDRDLGLTPLQLVLVVLDVEDAADVELPVEGLATVETVAELSTFFATHLVRPRRPQDRTEFASAWPRYRAG